MLVIDGSYGEGGGQILRTSVALSALTKTPIKITNLRKRRQNPGLRAQHISAIKAVGKLCNADIKGMEIGSTEMEFYPGEISDKKWTIDIGTAGSIPLVLQALLITAIHNDVEVEITGGTDVRFAPSIDYVKFVTLPILKVIGLNAEIEILKRGYYPNGGGKVKIVIKKMDKFERINFTEKGKISEIYGISHASVSLKGRNVAERQKIAAEKFLKDINIRAEIKEEYADTFSTGSGITLFAKTEKTIIGACSLGEINRKAEDVGIECAKNLISEIRSDTGVDSHISDQIIPYIALAKGKAKINTTMHAMTNIYTVNLFGFDVREKNGVVECE
ncbi:MAG: RNA 3'-terminal-phosphate cyclase [Candidatus Altiarchaeales archaeon A3]|nr:MAG: RNA 3'-terminal-phosphate cyclase [Candidatus Altiarchaeales archaeon A3]